MAIRALSLVLLVALALGLTAPAPAIAQAPKVASSVSAQVMAEDCAEMMADNEQSKQNPCDGTLHCMLAMGCLSVNLIAELDSTSAGPAIEASEEYWPAVIVLIGTTSGPEPDPPTIFG